MLSFRILLCEGNGGLFMIIKIDLVSLAVIGEDAKRCGCIVKFAGA